MELLITGDDLTCAKVVDVARDGATVGLLGEARQRVLKAEKLVRELVASGATTYGINTGIGELSNVVLSASENRSLQANIIRSHCVGVGEALPVETVRAIMLLRANALAKGMSGNRLQLLEMLLDMLNRGVHPVVPSKGSVGASGDLAPLSHIALVMMGEGDALFDGEKLPAGTALMRAGIEPLVFEGKEALCLNNGTQVMTAIGALGVHDAQALAKVADLAGAMTLEALQGVMTAFEEAVHRVRPHHGQSVSARNIRLLVDKSEILASDVAASKIHDPYCLRCIPQVHGASRDAIDYVLRVVETEMNSASDNPLVLADTGRIVSAGNFHGQPVAIAMDLLAIAVAELGSISERRTARLLDGKLSGLPAFLSQGGGLNSGLMLAQYTAAALVSENKVLAHPASVDSIPTSANWEDHVSMGTIGARKAAEILSNVQIVLAIELLCAAQALEFLGTMSPGVGTGRAREVIRRAVPPLTGDRVLYPDIEELTSMIRSGQLLDGLVPVIDGLLE
jgi:histidine ammonia-lyase